MAQRRITTVHDDITDEPGAEPFRFALDTADGRYVEYEIDLLPASIKALQSSLTELTSHARIVGKTKPTPKPQPNGYDPAVVRQWARGNGFDVPSRGRIPVAVLDRYNARG